ncbi:DUF1553 domain-containing protein [Rhodohalobacter sulfatireducens]|uniref:DUF1553 domain-containing protein n=1 Tax=Rhodohalobacter sulfatireducens TaxID=2911366 RepID=A0ABS9K8T3_9BACT|nr:DUF1553 domain-containing protein [Rhodohalobacter sulfatireducens]MCG2587259.1 DUF1553 domain-containing protein [Rhodohalobacter sulfatireducens]
MSDIFTEKKYLFLLLSGVILLFGGVYIINSHEKTVDYNKDIKPILNNQCIACHGGVKRSSGFSLLFQEEAYSPNESGKPAIVPGNPEESEMIRRINHPNPEERMPPEGEPLSADKIELLTQWIEQGAKWGEHWAYQKPQPVSPPQVNSGWVENDIDRFILRGLHDRDLKPSLRADKATLLRRVTLDLTGLPPTQKQLETFLNDDSPDAYEKVVNRLLDSPRYGERWAAMWMDLARYADSKGYEKDGHRNIWQYRDWLINAFNEDKPYDDFTIEQLAGDLLPNPTDQQIIATAFHRNTMNNDEGGTNDEEFRVAAVIDRVNTTWNVWLATTMECVQCHAHPYDPIRFEDFYRSYAYFNNTADEDVPSEAPTLTTFKSETDQQQLDEIKQWIESQIDEPEVSNQKIDRFVELIRIAEPKIHGHSFDEVRNGTITSTNNYLAVKHNGVARIKDADLRGKDRMFIRSSTSSSSGVIEIRKGNPDGPMIGRMQTDESSGNGGFHITSIPITPQQELTDLYLVFHDPGNDGYLNYIEWILFHQSLPGNGQPGHEETLDNLHALLNSKETIETPVMVELEGNYRRTTQIFERGNWMVHGDTVKPGVPGILNPMPEEYPENRLGLSRWMMSNENPLTARVMVNRLWAELFGTGIVETLSDFGSQGYLPSHPELLDWLALQFMNEHKWSIKKQLKQIVMSATYRQSSNVSPDLQRLDPKNRLLARGPRTRLTAEQVRDQALAVAGLLSDKMYGPSVMPPQPEGLWQVVYSGLEWKTSEGEDKYRRALYTYWRRTNPYPSMIAFDAPSREVCVVERINTNTPLQALVTLNDPVYVEAAKGLAERILEKTPNDIEQQLETGYRLAIQQDIGTEKLEDLKYLYQETKVHFRQHPKEAEELTGEQSIELAALTIVSNAIMNLDEFLTKS